MRTKQLTAMDTTAAADYNLAAWGPAAPPSTLEILEKKQNIAARIITGCAPDTPIGPLLAEAGLMKIQDRVAIQTVIQHEKTIRLPDNIPSKSTATRTDVKIKFAEFKKPEKKMCPPRETVTSLLIKMGLEKILREEAVRFPAVAPWEWGDITTTTVEISTTLDGCTGRENSIINKQRAFNQVLDNVDKNKDIVIYSDGSVTDGTEAGGGGIIIEWPGTEEPKERIGVPAGGKYSSYKAEFIAIEKALSTVWKKYINHPSKTKIWLFTDSQSVLERLQMGPGHPIDRSGDKTWKTLIDAQRTLEIRMQWEPGHSEIQGNEEADKLAKEACNLDQSDVPMDMSTVKTNVKRWIKERWREEIRSDPFYTQTTGGNSRSIPGLSRKDDILINQLKTGKTPVVRACLAFYKKKGRSERMCPECGVVEDVEHLLIKCRLWGRERQIHLGGNPGLRILNKEPVMVLDFMRAIGRTAAPTL